MSPPIEPGSPGGPAPPRVLVVGGGFAGLYAAKALRRAPVDVLLVDRRNHHLFQPLLYQVATAGLAAPDVARPLRAILRGGNARVILGDAARVDLGRRRVVLADGEELPYDQLILAAGLTTSYFGHDEWRRHAPGLKDLDDAFEIRRRTLLAFEAAEREEDDAARAALLTFVVVGAGPTGVELAGALREIATRTLVRDFRRFDPGRTRVVLVEGDERVLPAFPERLSAAARGMLEARGVELRLGRRVTGVDEGGVALGDERLAARTVLWAAGVRGEPLAATLGVELTRDGRVPVEPDLSLAGHPEVFVVGDLAHVVQDGEPVPAMAPGAIQMGRSAAANAARRARGEPTRPFRYRDRGALATVGRAAAVARIGRRTFAGLGAWLLWLVVHLFWLIGFRNRAVVLFEWAWAYLTWQRSARVVTGLRREGDGEGGAAGPGVRAGP